MSVEIHDQIAEGDRVTTRKTIRATHQGEFMGIPASNKKVEIHVIDFISLEDAQYAEALGSSNLADVITFISTK